MTAAQAPALSIVKTATPDGRILRAMDADLLPVLVHIQAGLDGDLSLAALSSVSGLSPSTLKRRIEATTGESPRRYVERLRLERAACQLRLRQGTILEIALDNGFCSHEVFGRAFSRHFGVTPSEWRDRQSAGGLGHNERQPGLSETMEGAAISSTRRTRRKKSRAVCA